MLQAQGSQGGPAEHKRPFASCLVLYATHLRREYQLLIESIDNLCGHRHVMMVIDIDLTPQLEEMGRQKVTLGLYTSASEVVN